MWWAVNIRQLHFFFFNVSESCRYLGKELTRKRKQTVQRPWGRNKLDMDEIEEQQEPSGVSGMSLVFKTQHARSSFKSPTEWTDTAHWSSLEVRMLWLGGQVPHEDSSVVPRLVTADGDDFRTLSRERKGGKQIRRNKYRAPGVVAGPWMSGQNFVNMSCWFLGVSAQDVPSTDAPCSLPHSRCRAQAFQPAHTHL